MRLPATAPNTRAPELLPNPPTKKPRIPDASRGLGLISFNQRLSAQRREGAESRGKGEGFLEEEGHGFGR